MKLLIKDRYTGCPRCNYQGCVWAREKYGEALGHWIWCLNLMWSLVRRWPVRAKRWLTRLDYSRIEDVEMDGIDTSDHPDFVDAFVSSATYKGREMSESELDRLNEDRDFVYQKTLDHLY